MARCERYQPAQPASAAAALQSNHARQTPVAQAPDKGSELCLGPTWGELSPLAQRATLSALLREKPERLLPLLPGLSLAAMLCGRCDPPRACEESCRGPEHD